MVKRAGDALGGMSSAPAHASRWVLFDIGGVLVEWDDRIIFRAVADRYGLELGPVTATLENLRRDLQSDATSPHEFWRRFARLFNVPVPDRLENPLGRAAARSSSPSTSGV